MTAAAPHFPPIVDFTNVAIWYVCHPTERGCPPPITEAVSRDTVWCDSGRFHWLDDKERIMGKGNNSQKNDKKDKKVKKDSKKTEAKK